MPPASVSLWVYMKLISVHNLTELLGDMNMVLCAATQIPFHFWYNFSKKIISGTFSLAQEIKSWCLLVLNY